MKKQFTLILLVALGFTACKKESQKESAAVAGRKQIRTKSLTQFSRIMWTLL
jgi:hypothetical protein